MSLAYLFSGLVYEGIVLKASRGASGEVGDAQEERQAEGSALPSRVSQASHVSHLYLHILTHMNMPVLPS